MRTCLAGVLFLVACGGKTHGDPNEVATAGSTGDPVSGATTTGGDTTTGAGGSGGTECLPPSDVDFSDTPPNDVPVGGCACTRRAGGSTDCPVSVGQIASGRIGPGGGTLVLLGQQGIASGIAANFEVPGGAVGHDTDLTIVETQLAPPGSLVDFSPVYRFEPVDLTLAVPAKFRIPFSSNQSPSSALSVYWGGCNGVFHRVPDSTVGDHAIEGTTTSLGWAVVGMPKDPSQQQCP